MAELQMLLDQEIPSGRKALMDSHNNLQRVASYCEQKYMEEPDKKVALEETKNYTTQSLASVAYQINTLASNMLQMLDIQSTQLANMDSAINNIAQTVDIHKEKVARREIGLLTNTKAIQRSHQIVAPSNPDRTVKYVRKPVDFSELDDVGHGIKLSNQPAAGSVRRHSHSSKKSPSNSVDGGSKRDSLKSNVSSYGTLRAVKAPTVPLEYSSHGNRRLPPMFRANSSSSVESGSQSSIGQAAAGAPPPPPPAAGIPSSPQNSNMPAPPTDLPPPPAMSPLMGAPPPPPVMSPLMGAPPPPPVMSPKMGAPPPPPVMSPQMGVPPPPPPAPAFSSSENSGGYSTPNIGYTGKPALAGGTAETYAATSVMDLPPPPPAGPPFGASRNPNLPTTGFAARVGSASLGVPPPPPPVGSDILPPPPPDDMFGSDQAPVSMEPHWAPAEYLEKMVVIYDYSANNEDELDLKEDQIVYVIKKNDDGWYEGVLEGVTGLFPGNYAEGVSS